MKKNLILLIALFMAFGALGRNVDQATAQKAASLFFRDHSGSKQSVVLMTSAALNHQNQTAYYFFNYAPKGFVIMSADDRMFPVIGYSPEGYADAENLPPSLRWWLESQVVEMKEGSSSAQYLQRAAHAWEQLIAGESISESKGDKSVNPLLSCKWDQGTGYNFHCPEYASGPGGRCYAGCVSTAMSQIMYYYKYPEQGQGSHTYQHVHFGNISADFGSTTYDWASMTNTLNNQSREAISTLMFHCGVSVDMNYSPLGSGAMSENAVNAFVSYFRYSNRLSSKSKNAYSNFEWNQMVMENLDLLQPLLYSGNDGGSGHAWVCDGYKDSCFFHMNWGWSGAGNGYYYLSNLNSGNGNFSLGQSAIFNICPYSYAYCVGERTIKDQGRTFDDGSRFSYYWNNTDCEWLIAPDTTTFITLIFNSFATEEGHDFLSIYDGENDSAPLIGTFSGHNLPPPVTTTGDKVYLRFTTDSTVQDLGWSITYQAHTSGIAKGNEALRPDIYPNPNAGQFAVKYEFCGEVESVGLRDISGKYTPVAFTFVSPTQLLVNARGAASGLYILEIRTPSLTLRNKLIIND